MYRKMEGLLKGDTRGGVIFLEKMIKTDKNR